MDQMVRENNVMGILDLFSFSPFFFERNDINLNFLFHEFQTLTGGKY